jgi:ribosomal protein RSM22 (predicted rRNA methylase)
MSWKNELSTYISGLYDHKVGRAPRSIAASVTEMSHNFSDLRRFRKNDYFSQPRSRSAYWAYFAPRNMGRVAFLLNQLQNEGHFEDLPPNPYVVDLGSGPLVGVAAYALRFPQSNVEFLAVDQSRQMLIEGRDYFSKYFPKEKMPVKIVSANLKGSVKAWGSRRPADLVVIANVLNEFGAPKRTLEQRIHFLEQVQSFIKPGGYLLIIEPAQRIASQGLSLVRDSWRGGRYMSLKAPCMSLQECPMGPHRSSWCHTSFFWEQPEHLVKLMDELGFQKNPLSLSYLLWQKKKKRDQRVGVRLVSQSVRRPGRAPLLLGCDDDNRIVEIKAAKVKMPEDGIYRGRWVNKNKNGLYSISTD